MRANMLAQQASGYDVRQGRFQINRRPASCNVLIMYGDGGESVSNNTTKEDDWRQA
jgi:hypothetical protein